MSLKSFPPQSKLLKLPRWMLPPPPNASFPPPSQLLELPIWMLEELQDFNGNSLYCYHLQGDLSMADVLHILETLWRPLGLTYAACRPDGIIQVWCHTKEAQQMILDKQPWVVDDHVVLLSEWQENGPAPMDSFKFGVFWVHVSTLACFRDQASIEFVALEFFEVLDYDLPESLMDPKTPRVRVRLPLAHPFPVGCILKLPNGKKIWVQFSYEHLPELCIHCGRLRHGLAYCNNVVYLREMPKAYFDQPIRIPYQYLQRFLKAPPTNKFSSFPLATTSTSSSQGQSW